METLIIGSSGSGKSSYLKFIAKEVIKENSTAIIMTESGEPIEDILPEGTRIIHFPDDIDEARNIIDNGFDLEEGEKVHIIMGLMAPNVLKKPFFEAIEKGVYNFREKQGSDVAVIIDIPAYYKYTWGITHAAFANPIIFTAQSTVQLPMNEREHLDEPGLDILVTSINDIDTANDLSKLMDNEFDEDELMQLSRQKVLLFQDGTMHAYDKDASWQVLKTIMGM